jgi:hypothetical protein
MKKIGLFLIAVSFLFACNNNDEFNETQNGAKDEKSLENSFPRISENSKIGGINIPDGTIMDKIDDSNIKITFPKGYELWQLDENGRFEIISESSYTCTCSGEKGCNVFYVKGEYGCSHGSCTGSCTGEFNNSFTQARFYILNTNSEMQSATDEEFDDLPYLPGELVPYFNKKFKEYAQEIYGNKFSKAVNYIDNSSRKTSDINDIMFVKMKMYGYKFVYGINAKELNKNLIKSNSFTMADDEKHSCKCESGSSGCTADSSWGVKYCEGGSCSKCTMSVN